MPPERFPGISSAPYCKAFDYGYDFSECGAQKFFHSQGAGEFLHFYCFYDYPISRTVGYSLERTVTLAEGYSKGDHRIKKGRKTELEWSSQFIEGKDKLDKPSNFAVYEL